MPVSAGDFEAFFVEAEPRLRRALVAACGRDGRDATAEALAWAWENWDRVEQLTNPTAYLYRVGRSKVRRRRQRPIFAAPASDMPWVEPALTPALAALSEQQRVVVVLVHGYGWSHREVAELLEVSASTVQSHLERALARLRAALEATSDA